MPGNILERRKCALVQFSAFYAGLHEVDVSWAGRCLVLISGRRKCALVPEGGKCKAKATCMLTSCCQAGVSVSEES
eukprot:1161600-Pelagomonas_calceolata.AAC.4